MAKRRSSTLKSRITKAWLRTRPDKKYSVDYDQFYIDLAEELRVFIGKMAPIFSKEFDESAEINLAVVIAGYFEDFISEVGIWKAFTDRFREELGSDLPFYDLEGYDPDYINWQDIALLIWVWSSRDFEKGFTDPLSSITIEFAKLFTEVLDEKIDHAPATSLFDEFLEVKDANKFFDVRFILNWLAIDSWLIGLLDKSFSYERELNKMIAENEQDSVEFLNMFEHDLIQDLTFNDITKFGGLYINELAVRILRGDQKLKENLEGMGRKFAGEFEMVGTEKNHYVLLHLDSMRKVRVTRKSVELQPSLGNYVFTSLSKWGGEFWVNGACLPSYVPIQERAAEPYVPYYLANEKEREEITMNVADQEAVFKDVFKSSLVLCKGSDALNETALHYFETLELFNAKKLGRDPIPVKLPSLDLPKMAINGTTAIYFAPGEGMTFNPIAGEIVNYLQGGTGFDFLGQGQVLIALLRYCDIHLARYINANYGLQEAIEEEFHLDLDRDLTALCWFVFPKGCAKPEPNLSILNNEVE